MKIIFETGDFGEALVKKAHLEQEGFFVYLDNYNWGNAEPYLGMALGYRLWGVSSELMEARDCLNSPHIFASDEYDAIGVCRACGGENIVRYRVIWWLFLNWMMGIYLASPGGNRRKCMDCGHKFKAEGPAITGPFKALIAFGVLYVAVVLGAGYVWTPTLFGFVEFLR